MKRLLSLFLALFMSTSCGTDVLSVDVDETDFSEDALKLATDTKIKNAVMKAAQGLYYMSESDHEFVWVRSSRVSAEPANAHFIYKNFSKVTNNDAMADKPLSRLKSETIPFESFAVQFKPVPGEDADNFAYHQKMTQMLSLLRENLQNPVVIRFGRTLGDGLVGAISVYIVGTLPSGKVGGVFTVSVET